MHADEEYEDEQPRVIYRPGQVSAAAIVVGVGGLLTGVVLGLGGAASGQVVGIAVGVTVVLITVALVTGLWRGYRGSQWVAVGLAALWILSGLHSLETGQGGLVQIALAGLLVWLLIGTARAREWFS